MVKALYVFLPLLLIKTLSFSQVKIPDYYRWDKPLSDSLERIILSVGLNGDYNVGEDGIEQISLAVIDLNGNEPVLAGVNAKNFIYPASVYKMYAGMEVLKQISDGHYSLYNEYIVQSPNDVDQAKEIKSDPRPLLRHGDTVTINYLLDLMITRSDNSAANCIIDIASRDSINKTMHRNGWQGSEVTRKFLRRKYEDPGYETIRGTETCALHAADFMYRMYTNQLINPWVSMQMKSYLGRQLDTAKLAAGLPEKAMFYHKTGWWSFYTHDVGLVDDGKIRYIIALFTPIREAEVSSKLRQASEKIFRLIKRRYQQI